MQIAYEKGYLGANVAGSGKSFDLEARLGAGAYICGEETSLLESLEGKRGQIRYKPPLPAIEGLFGKPTVVNNVISLATVPVILDKGAEYYANFGMGKSRGTLTIQLAGNIKYGGLVEKAFGLTLREAIYDFGGGTASGRPLRAVQVGGPLGAYFPESLLDTPLDYEAFTAKKGWSGHGGIVVFDDTVDLARQARFAMEFCAIESCGKCTPCRIGSTRGVEVIDRIIADQDRTKNLELLDDLCELLVDGSLCALGGLTPYPVLSAVQHFPEDFAKPAATPTLRDQLVKRHTMALIQEIDYGTPAQRRPDPGDTRRWTANRSPCASGTSVMRAAMEAGVQVPKLCATDNMKAFGSCRLCLVEIEGRRGTPASCTTLVEPGMKVRTSSPKLSKLRRGVMELYISDHPLDCLTCAANGNCELQDMAGVVGLREVRYGYDGANHFERQTQRTSRIRTSLSSPPNASFARAASVPAKKFRALSR